MSCVFAQYPTTAPRARRGSSSATNRKTAAGVEMKLVNQSAAADDGQPTGESHFESDSPMTILKGTSALVAVLDWMLAR